MRITWLQWMRSPARLGFVFYLTCVLPIGVALMTFNSASHELGLAEATFVALGLNLVLGAGIICREREDGVIATVLSRPIRRSTYVLAKWLALALASWAGTLLFIALQCLIFYFSYWHPIDLLLILKATAECAFLAFGLAATMVALSSWAPSYGDLVLYGVAWVFLMMISSFVEVLETIPIAPNSLMTLFRPAAASLHHLSEALFAILMPMVNLPIAHGLWLHTLIMYMSNLFGALLFAIWWLNRKEITYGG